MEESYINGEPESTDIDKAVSQKSPSSDSAGNNPKILVVLSNFFSGIFLPLLVPTYAYIIALWTTYLSLYPERLRLISSVVVFAITALVPLAVILFLMRRGRVSDVSIDNPRERTIPYLATILCYFLVALYLWLMPRWLPMFFVGAGVAAMIATIITFKYKISAHTTSMGGLCALIFFTGVHHIAIVQILPWLSLAILASGAVGSARIFLGRHTASQVYSGWLLGFVLTTLFMNF